VCWRGLREFGEEDLNLELGLELDLVRGYMRFAPPPWNVQPWSAGEMRTRLEIILQVRIWN
jgi:hypothetical protein